MPKIDWSKVEKLFGEGVEDYDAAEFQEAIQKLIKQMNQDVKAPAELPDMMPQPQTIALLLKNVGKDLRAIDKRDPEKRAGMDADEAERRELQKQLAHFGPEQWQQLKALRSRVGKALMEIIAAQQQDPDKMLISRNQLTLKKKGRYIFGNSQRPHWRTL